MRHVNILLLYIRVGNNRLMLIILLLIIRLIHKEAEDAFVGWLPFSAVATFSFSLLRMVLVLLLFAAT